MVVPHGRFCGILQKCDRHAGRVEVNLLLDAARMLSVAAQDAPAAGGSEHFASRLETGRLSGQ